ncbi:hypothetical protein Acr_17g0006650 [Actinidia rufa]|uniref:DOG1 domain-containing protein n=1 Tax=Actinidia rufa TaxID=165716 RepID=A0A7J0G2T8_9ERIC|nr:hypothetical protein Acr_17g0006650 [Actinidia rufa]
MNLNVMIRDQVLTLCKTKTDQPIFCMPLIWMQDSSSDILGMCANIDGKIEELVKILEKADDLRMRTVGKVVDLLTPQQAVEFLIAAAELQFGVHCWGLNQDRLRRNV